MKNTLSSDQIVLTLRKLLQPKSASDPGQSGPLTVQAPMIGANAAQMLLHCGSGRLRRWILEGEIEWAFDLRRHGAKKPLVLILTDSITRKQQRRRDLSPDEAAARAAAPFSPIFDTLFRHRRPHLLTTELSRAWSCSPDHIRHLVNDRTLPVVKRKYAPRQARLIPREAALAFMESRRMR